MLSNQLPQYSALPLLASSQLQSSGRSLVFYDQLVVDITDFRHPGTAAIMQPHLHHDIESVFESLRHSFNAKLMLVNLAVARREDRIGRGYEVFKQVRESKLATIHEKLMSELDLSSGLLVQLQKRTVEQLQAFVNVPKYYSNSADIKFTETPLQQFLYRDRFWVSTSIFTIIMGLMVWYCARSEQLFNSFFKFQAFAMGILAWTAIEYYFHRIVLHVQLAQGKRLTGHYIHHAFPNHRNKLALTISFNLTIESIVLGIMVYGGIDQFVALHFMLGLHMFMTLYDVMHFYFHFGPETSFGWLNKMKKNHMKHHFRDSDRGFGVTTTLWDWVFGTQHIK